ncbi:MAG: 50S ribosomal protein L19 [Candidatus Berkelbacteria bacterium]|nr:MAG: 50S ribosomal protein L19 [Candidatus Berkelbacteria bacterium]QQG51616.1 MAG: 50S ribosomal protein L19 [Candidatus Berkelbacteria bacterium]
MDTQGIIKKVESASLKKSIPDVRSGETVRVHYKIREGNKERIQIFEGLVISTSKGGNLQGSFTVRKVVSGVGVERSFPIHSPHIAKIERLKSGKVRRAKLYFVRRHAASPKRFRLKDRGVAGTIWEEVAKEQEAIAQEEENIESTEVAPEEVALEPETTDNASDDESSQESGTGGGDAGSEVVAEEGPSDPSPESEK